MFEPVYKASRLVVGNPESNIGIVSLWTKNKKLAEKIDPTKYAVIGQLFSAERGLDIFVRNMLANPGITNILITGTDFSKSGVVLMDFFERGFEKGRTDLTGREVWKVRSEHPGYIETDIPEQALNELRDTTTVQFVEDMEDFDFDSVKKPARTRIKQVFNRPENPSRSFTGEESAYVVRHEKIAGVWLQILDTILKFGKRSDTHYDDYQKEILNLISVITDEDPEDFHIPDFLPCDRERVESYIPKVTTDFKEAGTSYTYGSRMRSWFEQDQVKEAVAKLVRERNSRAVVVDLWDSSKDLTIGGSPCINHIWFRIRDGKLYMTVTIRSNDIFEAYPENAYGLRSLQEIIRKELNLSLREKGLDEKISLGELIINSQSAHIYDDCFDSAMEIVQKNYSDYIKEPQYQRDPRGYFVIFIQDGKILAEHNSPQGELIGTYQAETAWEMKDTLATHGLVGNTAHAIYMGTELQKAELALKNNLEYEQDTPLELPKPSQEKLPPGGKLVSVRRIEDTGEAVLTYIVNDREFPLPTVTTKEEERFKEFLRGRGLSRVF
jgi:thymidylate synthase